MCLNRRTVLYFGLPWGVQAGCLAPGLENPILEAGPNYYIFLYAPYTARTHFGSGGYGTTLGGSGRLPARAWAWARAWAPGPGGWLGYASCLWAWLWVWAWPWPCAYSACCGLLCLLRPWSGPVGAAWVVLT